MLSDRFGQSNKFWKKSQKKNCSDNVLGTSRINLSGTSLERQIRMSPGCHFKTSPRSQIGTSPGRQIETSLGQSNRILRVRPAGVGGRRPREVTGTNICQQGYVYYSQKCVHIEETLMKLNTYLFNKDDKSLKKYNEIWEQLEIVSKKNLTVNQYIMKISKS